MQAREDAEGRPATFEEVGPSGRDVLVAADVDHRIVLAGPGIEPLLGWTAAELAGRPLETILPAAWIEARETRAHRRDGTQIPVEVTSTQLGDTRLLMIHDLRRRRAL